MDKNIEVELRSCLDENKYVEMINFFTDNATLILDGERITTKYIKENSLVDLRIRKDWKGSLLTLKLGYVNNAQREEHEVVIDDPEKMQKIIQHLGLAEVHSWKTIRKKFYYNGFEVCIDDIPGFMKTLEIEKMCSLHEVQSCKKEIEKLFDALGLKVIDPEWFSAEIKKYNNNFLSGKIKI